MIWQYFTYFALSSILMWIVSIVILYIYKNNKKLNIYAIFVSAFGVLLIFIFVIILWFQLNRPPMRTLGETRLWYSFFLSAIGIVAYIRWKYKWFFSYSLIMAILFLFINLQTPENYSKTLMPALQSPWFVPHVIVYMFAYALLGASSIVGFKGLYDVYIQKKQTDVINIADNLVFTGFAFLTMGLLFGALWAKEAWGHYWTWDPKETWAFISWAVYIVYIHISYFQKYKTKTLLWILAISFVILLMCWFGIKYLPTAQNSVHLYSR